MWQIYQSVMAGRLFEEHKLHLSGSGMFDWCDDVILETILLCEIECGISARWWSHVHAWVRTYIIRYSWHCTCEYGKCTKEGVWHLGSLRDYRHNLRLLRRLLCSPVSPLNTCRCIRSFKCMLKDIWITRIPISWHSDFLILCGRLILPRRCVGFVNTPKKSIDFSDMYYMPVVKKNIGPRCVYWKF